MDETVKWEQCFDGVCPSVRAEREAVTGCLYVLGLPNIFEVINESQKGLKL